ncbi:hypothetical protein IAD21_03464 [Abditibacteriota bacterium]|nr:hypothetical protein IAD21_03464 [Abditibacteriota bacterium]
MSSDIAPHFLRSFLDLFEEAYSGPPDPSSTWFTDNAPRSALLGTLDGLDDGQASFVLPGGQSIASHAEHLRWSLVLAQAYLRGEHPQANWEESWRVLAVSEIEWETLRSDLRHEYEAVRAALATISDWSNPFFVTGTLALLPHAAYHLGAIRQMVRFVSKE